ncbi:hypothetical protein [Actinoplanes sp. NPDC049599]|uniref:hypothetical protein n=1 Tax=Actinoplanes sp. NPDC049599 TaxID=3363903 RepID=UPI0037A93C76
MDYAPIPTGGLNRHPTPSPQEAGPVTPDSSPHAGFTAVVMVLGQLAFVFAGVRWASLDVPAALRAAAGATALGLAAVYGRPALLSIGRFLRR